MKRKIFVSIFLFIVIFGKAQISPVPLNTSDSSVGVYITHSMENFKEWDSCFAGIYFLKFSLSSEGDLTSFSVTESIPLPFKNEFEKKLKELKGKWSPLFLNYVANGSRVILQPLFIDYDKGCFYRENFYSKKLFSDSSGEEFKYLVAEATLTTSLNLFLSVKETFMQSVKSNDSYTDCILLPPAFLTPTARIYKGARFD